MIDAWGENTAEVLNRICQHRQIGPKNKKPCW